MQGINIILRSDNVGAGKTYAAVSFSYPNDEQTRRLVYDGEYRARPYKSSDGHDHPDKHKYAFDLLHEKYGELSSEVLIKLYQDIKSGKFNYDLLVIDNAVIFEDTMKKFLVKRSEAVKVADAFELSVKHATLLRAYDPGKNIGGFFYFMKSIVSELMRACKQYGIAVIVTTESRNEWQNYGKRDMKKLGQTVRCFESWLQYADAIYVLTRIHGDRAAGKGKLKTYPLATQDTLNPKCSIPQLKPQFEFTSWNVIWDMISSGEVPTEADYAAVEVPAAEYPEEGVMSLDDAKNRLVTYAVRMGVMLSEGDREGAEKMKKAAAERGLDIENAVSELGEWMSLIEELGNAA